MFLPWPVPFITSSHRSSSSLGLPIILLTPWVWGPALEQWTSVMLVLQLGKPTSCMLRGSNLTRALPWQRCAKLYAHSPCPPHLYAPAASVPSASSAHSCEDRALPRAYLQAARSSCWLAPMSVKPHLPALLAPPGTAYPRNNGVTLIAARPCTLAAECQVLHAHHTAIHEHITQALPPPLIPTGFAYSKHGRFSQEGAASSSQSRGCTAHTAVGTHLPATWPATWCPECPGAICDACPVHHMRCLPSAQGTACPLVLCM